MYTINYYVALNNLMHQFCTQKAYIHSYHKLSETPKLAIRILTYSKLKQYNVK